MVYHVKKVARLAGVSVRTLHHYDHIGLLKPDSVTEAGYRCYSDENLETLQQILFFKELGFSLEETKQMLYHPDFDRYQALKNHYHLLLKQRNRLSFMIESVEKTIQSIEQGTPMKKKDMFKGFDSTDIEKHQAQYANETRQKYGHTTAYQESQRRMAKYSKPQVAGIMQQAGAIFQKIADLMELPPTDPRVQQAVGEWRQHITNSFYPCTLEIFRGLADLYVEDERFTKNIDKVKPGLARFMQAAMHIYFQQATH